MYTDRVMVAPSTIIQNPEMPTPQMIADHLVLLEFSHWNFEKEIKTGRIIIHQAVVGDLQAFFALAFGLGFPIHQSIPVSEFCWNDEMSCAANNSSGHNMRYITNTTRWSKHAAGTAFDINPMQNPCYDVDETTSQIKGIIPEAGQYDPRRPGTLYRHHPLVQLMIDRGWSWGGNWSFPLDLQHFQIVLPEHVHLFG